MIYIIKKLWIDAEENNPLAASGYGAVGYVKTKEEAEKIVADGGLYTARGYPIVFGKPSNYIYEEVNGYFN